MNIRNVPSFVIFFFSLAFICLCTHTCPFRNTSPHTDSLIYEYIYMYVHWYTFKHNTFNRYNQETLPYKNLFQKTFLVSITICIKLPPYFPAKIFSPFLELRPSHSQISFLTYINPLQSSSKTLKNVFELQDQS